MNCNHEFENNDFRAKCKKCGLAFNYIINPDKWNEDGTPRIKEIEKTTKVKINWKRELHSTSVLAEIEEILNTYWEDEYKLWKIRKVIARWRGKEIEEVMECEDPIEYLLTKRREKA